MVDTIGPCFSRYFFLILEKISHLNCSYLLPSTQDNKKDDDSKNIHELVPVATHSQVGKIYTWEIFPR